MYKVLLVDDEYMILSGLKQIVPWEELGFELVGTATNGKEALDFILNNDVDVMLSDITMPIMSGIDCLRELRRRQLNVKTIFLSGYQEFEFVREGMTLGAVDYLVKPVDRKELILALKKSIKLLEEERNQVDYKKIKTEQQLKKWVMDQEATTLIESLNLASRKSVNVFVGEYKHEAFLDYLQTIDNLHYYVQGDQQIVGILLDYERADLANLYKNMAELFPKDLFVFAGTLKKSYKEIRKSYDVAITLKDSYYFYNLVQDGCVWLELDNQLEEIYYSSTDDLPFLSKGGAKNSLREKIKKIIHYFERTPIPPNHARYFMLVILSDARTYYDIKPDGSYQEEIDRIREISNINEITEAFLELETLIKQQISERSYSELTQKTINIVHREYSKDLLLKEIAEELYVNPMYLGQLIKKETGQTFSQYLNSYRMKKAEGLLLKSRKTVNEIAHAVGYSSTGYFHKNFKETYCLTPKDFRKNYMSVK